MFTSDDYRTTVKVLNEHPHSTLRELTDMANALDAREEAARKLGVQARLWSQDNSDPVIGLKLFSYLLGAGWTAPKGLF